jgi:hypothetical protein
MCKIVYYPAAPLRSLVEKHLTENQVLGERTDNRSKPATEDSLAYISWYINGYGRP